MVSNFRGYSTLIITTMAPLNYAKWDNIDTDSEPETENPAPKAPNPIPRTAPTSSSVSQIKAVIVRCNKDKGTGAPWSATTIPSDHVVFSHSVPPIPSLIQIPLVIHRVGTTSFNQADLDNQIATYLNIDAESGFAPDAWQSHVGTVIVARQDKKPLLPHHLEGVWMYCDMILDIFGDGEGAPKHLYNKQAFQKWWKRYCEDQKGFRTGTGGEDHPDDWRVVRSPYEM